VYYFAQEYFHIQKYSPEKQHMPNIQKNKSQYKDTLLYQKRS